MNQFLVLLKRIWHQGIIRNLLGLLTLGVTILFGYDQFIKIHSAEVTPYILGDINNERKHKVMVVITQDTVNFTPPDITYTFRNTSKYTIENLVVEVIYKVPVGQFNILPSHNRDYEYKSMEIGRQYVEMSYVYKCHSFSPNDVTPNFFKNITFLRQQKSSAVYNHILVDTNIFWDGKDKDTYTSEISYFIVEDTVRFNKPMGFDEGGKFTRYRQKAINLCRDQFSSENQSLVFLYHAKTDTISNEITKGAESIFKKINTNNIDSINSSNLDFLLMHLFGFNNPKIRK